MISPSPGKKEREIKEQRPPTGDNRKTCYLFTHG
jgi:hypothetical protein